MPRRDVYTLSQAAEYCGITLATLRKRSDRGSLQTTKREDGVRLVTHDELERADLLAGTEVQRLRHEVEGLRQEISVHRRLAQSAQAEAHAEREGHQRVTEALVEQRAIATTAQARADELEQLERDLAAAGPIRAWRIARQRRSLSAGT